MQRLYLLFRAHQIDPARYFTAPKEFDFDGLELLFVPCTTADDKANLALGEDAGEDQFIIATANAGGQPNHRPSVTSDTRPMPFCELGVDVKLGRSVCEPIDCHQTLGPSVKEIISKRSFSRTFVPAAV